MIAHRRGRIVLIAEDATHRPIRLAARPKRAEVAGAPSAPPDGGTTI